MTRAAVEDFLSISPAVSQAVRSGQAVVALETTVVTHGFPASEGLELALELEQIVRQTGAVPATIGILDSRAVIGLSAPEIERLAAASAATKLNLSNLAAGLVSGRAGSTTVAATLLLAHHAGIRVLATGGIGGVHRQAQHTGDVSADLTALARHPLAVVCAGAKAVLDLPRTLEVLESLGVPILGFRTARFPAFYRRDSGLALDWRFDTPEDLAGAIRAHFATGSGGGVVVANPIDENHEMPESLYRTSLDQALQDAAIEAVRGRDLTPFLLNRLRELTAGESSLSNRALLQSNARLAGRLAVELAG